jgi:hypothetical protein
MLAALAEAQAKTVKPGRPKEEETRYNIPNLKRGTSTEETLRRIANDAPNVLERYEAGEFASVAAAARAAGIKVGQSPLQKLRSVQHPGATTETNCGNHLTEQKAPDVRCQFSGGRLNRPEILAKLINLQLSI